MFYSLRDPFACFSLNNRSSSPASGAQPVTHSTMAQCRTDSDLWVQERRETCNNAAETPREKDRNLGTPILGGEEPEAPVAEEKQLEVELTQENLCLRVKQWEKQSVRF